MYIVYSSRFAPVVPKYTSSQSRIVQDETLLTKALHHLKSFRLIVKMQFAHVWSSSLLRCESHQVETVEGVHFELRTYWPKKASAYRSESDLTKKWCNKLVLYRLDDHPLSLLYSLRWKEAIALRNMTIVSRIWILSNLFGSKFPNRVSITIA